MKELFKKNNIKYTKQRERVYNIIKDNPITMKEILNNKDDIDSSTIYRIIEMFLEKNLIIKIVDGSEIYYAINDEHSHYINCMMLQCWVLLITEISKDLGYTLLSHSLIMDGLCPTCNKKA